MERVVYSHMADLDQRHWWYLGRRRVLASLIDRLARPPADGRILEVGCGTGHNLTMLRQFADVDAVELDESVRAIAESRLGRQVMSARLPELTGVADRNYDLIAALDVIEHISDDTAALQAIARKLRPGGKLVITVPAHPWMWSAHDV
nr:class I SAM-dependent methyltransferase [Sphingomonas sp.]